MVRNITKNALALAVSGGVRILFGMIIQVVIARALGAEVLGKFAVMTAYIAIFQVVAQLGLQDLLVREVARHRDEAGVYWWSTAPVLVVGGMAAWALQTLIATLWGHPADTYLMVIIAGASLVPFGIVIVSEATLRGLERMEVIPTVQSIAYSVYALGVVLVALLRLPIVTLGWAMVALQVVSALLYTLYLAARRVVRWPRIDVTLARALLRQAPHFYGVPVAAIIPERVGIIIIAKILGEEASGIFNIAQVLVRALFFVSVGYSEALYPALSRLFVAGEERFRQGVRQSIYYGLVLPTVLSLTMAAWAPWLVDVVFDARTYHDAIPLLRILSWTAVFFVLNGVFSVIEMAANRQDLMFYVSVAKVVIFLIVLPVATWWGGLTGAAIGSVVGGLITIFIHAGVIHRLTRGLPAPGRVVRALAAIALGIVAMAMTLPLPFWAAMSVPLIVYPLALFTLGALRLQDVTTFTQQILGQRDTGPVRGLT